MDFRRISVQVCPLYAELHYDLFGAHANSNEPGKVGCETVDAATSELSVLK